MQSQKARFATLSFKAGSKLSCAITLSTVSAIMALTGCATSTKHSAAGPDALVIASCPELTPLNDGSFGATTTKLVEVAGIYYACREAALAGKVEK
jgi:hypothetical protein